MDWFLYDRDFYHERVNYEVKHWLELGQNLLRGLKVVFISVEMLICSH